MTRYFAALFMFIVAWPSFAADPNGYTALYECRAGGPNCNVDVASLTQQSCQQVVTASTPWSNINWSNNVICIEAGDHTGKGVLTIGTSGNSSARKVLRYYRSGDNGDEPWNQSDGNKAKILGLNISADYWVVHRLTFPGVNGTSPSARIVSGAGKTNQIINRILVEGNGSASNYYGYSQDCNQSGYSDITVQNSIFRNVGPYAPIIEAVAVDLQCGSNLRAVNNEIYDWVAHPIQLGQNNIPTLAGIVVENNDLYVSPALYTNAGAKAKSESALSVKVAGTASSPVIIIHNRIWGTRKTDLNYCCNGEDGDAIAMYDANKYVLFQNNIIFDAQIGINNVAGNNSFIGNLFYAIKKYDAGTDSLVWNSWLSHIGASSYEMYLNTVVDAEQYAFPPLTDSNVDVRCNVVIASGGKYSGSSPSSTVIDYNTFYGSPVFTANGTGANINRPVSNRNNSTSYGIGTVIQPSTANGHYYMAIAGGTTASSAPSFCTSLGCSFSDGSVTWSAIRGPYTFMRKLHSSPEAYTIPYARAHASAPEANGCPANYAGRSGIGISNSN